MFHRLSLMRLDPQQIFEMGCSVGADAWKLAELYPVAQVTSIEHAEEYREYAARRTEKKSPHWLLSTSDTIPLTSHSIDMIFSPLFIPWHADPTALIREWRRVLSPGGLVIFSSLGPDTFKELRGIAGAKFLPECVDMHNIGDALLLEGFADPVLEVEEITLTYRSIPQMEEELKKSGMMTGSLALLPRQEDVYSVTFEVIYGHAWCPLVKGYAKDESGVVRIPVSELRKR